VKKSSVPEKANKILNGVLVVLVLVAIKVWHLSVVQHDKKIEESKKPQRRTILEKSERASIYDRFGIPLATNKVQYNVAISYAPIRDMPRCVWKEDERGKRYKFFKRKEYITSLAHKLSEELHLDAQWLEDMIHSKAAILGNVPCCIKENISENQYFRLKMMAKDWPGIHAEVAAKRCYPLGPVAGEVVGYIGPISRKEYDLATREMGILREALAALEEGEEIDLEEYRSVEQIKARLDELEKKAYRINDMVGKVGVEAVYDETLRGLCGRHIYLSDIKGNSLCELPGSVNPVSGNRLVLSLSSELQEFAQQLLAEYDTEPFSSLPTALKKRALIPENQPWIKGGSIVALDPKTGEIYALASFPTFDPNDFIRAENDGSAEQKGQNVERWLETEGIIGKIWDMKIPHSRLRFEDGYYEDNLEMGWQTYLSFILPQQSPVRRVIEEKSTIADAIWIQRKIEQLMDWFQDTEFALTLPQIFDFIYENPSEVPTKVTIFLQEKAFMAMRAEQIKEELVNFKKELDVYFHSILRNDEKILLVDLYQLAVDPTTFTPFLEELFGQMSLTEYRDVTARFSTTMNALKKLVREIYLEHDFKKWREDHFSEFLIQKRQQEKDSHKRYARPYIEYLEYERTERFNTFWDMHQWELIALFLNQEDAPEMSPYSSILGNWTKELDSGAHQGLDWVYHYHRLKALTDSFEPTVLIPFLKTLRPYEQLTRPLLGKYSGLRGKRERDLAAAFYPMYGLGFSRSHAFRQASTIGSIFKMIPAYEALRQRYQTLKNRAESLLTLNPLTIIDDKRRIPGTDNMWNVGFTLDGKPISMFYRGGRLPRSDHSGIGKVDLVKALETSSNPYFAMLAGDVLSDPEDLCHAAHQLGFGEKSGIDLTGEYGGRLPIDVAYNRTGLYSLAIGQHSLVGTPLQTALMLATIANGGSLLKPHVVQAQYGVFGMKVSKPEIRRQVYMPKPIQELLLSGLKQVIWGDRGTARHLRKQYDPILMSQIIGKTSTSEVVERISLDGAYGQMKLKHVWFGAISYEPEDPSIPELVVVVYLRYGEWGHDAAPLAIEIIKKWRDLKQKYYKI